MWLAYIIWDFFVHKFGKIRVAEVSISIPFLVPLVFKTRSRAV